MPIDTNIQTEYNEAYNHAWAAAGPWQTEAKSDIRAGLGDIWTADERLRMALRNSDILNIQLIRPIIKWVAGFQVDHRKGIKYSPVENADILTSDDFTEIGNTVTKRNNGYSVISKAFEHALTTGLCMVDVFNDLNENTRLQQYFYNQFLLDPAWTKLDLSDCNFMMMRKFVTKEEARILLPEEFKSDIKKIDPEETQTDGKYPNLVTPVQYGHKMFSYDQFQQRDTEQKITIIIRATGKQMIWPGTKAELEQNLPIVLQQMGLSPEMITTRTSTVPTVKVSAFLDGKHVATVKDPFGLGDYSATPIQCFHVPEYDEMKWKLQGMVRSLKDIQRAESKRIISSVAWFENSVSNGVDFEEGAFTDVEDAFQTGMGPRSLKEGGLDKIRDRQTPPIPGGMLELHNLLTDLMPKTVNVNPDMMGLPPDSGAAVISGLLAELRVGSGMVGLRGLFGDLEDSQNIIGRKLLKLYQQYPMDKVTRILGREPAEGYKEHQKAEFDAVTSSAPLTETQKNTQYQELLNLIKIGQEIGKPFPAEWKDVLEIGTLQISPELLKKIEAAEQQQSQQSQAEAEQAQQVQEVTISLLQSQANQANAKASETPSNIQKNNSSANLDDAKSAETITQAELNESKSGGVSVDIQQSVLTSAIALGKLQLEQRKLNQPIQNGAK